MHAYGQFRCKATKEVAEATFGLAPFSITLPDGTHLTVGSEDFFLPDGIPRSLPAKQFVEEWEPLDQVGRKFFALALRYIHP
jgi:hypothetical protein